MLKSEQPSENKLKQEGQPDFGTLYLCATPIGNLEDITFRVLRILGEVDLIAAEDTRHTRGLLKHFDLDKPLTSYYQHNQHQKGPLLIQQLLQGKSIALVSDAGTPGISDPGEELVRLALAQGILVVALPGPSVVLPALSVSGLSTQRFVFEGFLPRNKNLRKQRIQNLAREERTVVIFEAPHRLLETLSFLHEILGLRQAAVAREMSKHYEEVLRGDLGALFTHFQEITPRGEITLVIAGAQISELESESQDQKGELAVSEEVLLEEVLGEIQQRAAAGDNPKGVIRQIAQKYSLNRRALYQKWVALKEEKLEHNPD